MGGVGGGGKGRGEGLMFCMPRVRARVRPLTTRCRGGRGGQSIASTGDMWRWLIASVPFLPNVAREYCASRGASVVFGRTYVL